MTGPRVDGTTPAVHDLTPDELAAWEALAADATPGPWRIEEEQISYATSGYRLYDPTGNCVAGNFDYEIGGICERGDAAFIAAAREAVPRLAAALRAAWDRAGLLHDALADASRNIGSEAPLGRATRVLRADSEGKLSPRHVDGKGVPQFCDDAERDFIQSRAELASQASYIRELIAERDRMRHELTEAYKGLHDTAHQDAQGNPATCGETERAMAVMRGLLHLATQERDRARAIVAAARREAAIVAETRSKLLALADEIAAESGHKSETARRIRLLLVRPIYQPGEGFEEGADRG